MNATGSDETPFGPMRMRVALLPRSIGPGIACNPGRMKRHHTQLIGTLSLAAALVLTGCGAAASTERSARPVPGVTATTDLEALYWDRIESARLRFTAADVSFMTGMIGHHAQALLMARLAPTHGASRSVRTLAARIINAQQDEIQLMQQWLRDRGQPVPQVHIDGMALMVHGVGDHATHTHMPGMLTQDQLIELDRARGAAFDRLFLTYMIRHHRGAITMVDELIGTDGAAQDPSVFKFAADVQVDQATEVARMELMLETLPAAGEP